MIPRKISNRYIKALLNAASAQGKVEEVEQDLREIDSLLKENPDFINLLTHPKISRQRKKMAVDQILGKRISAIVKSFLDFVIEKKREQILIMAFEDYQNAADALRGIVKASVRSAFDLSEVQLQKLKTALEKQLQRTLKFRVEVDNTLLGGLQVFIGNDILDGSVKGRLTSIQKHLLEAGPS